MSIIIDKIFAINNNNYSIISYEGIQCEYKIQEIAWEAGPPGHRHILITN